MSVVVLVGTAVRLALIPLGHGQDFVVWNLASAATLHGVDIYRHHPDYPGGPFAYFPLFVYVEVPMQWLAQHTGVPFTVLGKLPILVSDLACAGLLAAEVRRHTSHRWVVAAAVALFFWNPLVIYNSAYYGRFDTVACAFLLLAYRGLRGRRGPGVGVRTAVYYALAVAAKTFPVFVLPGVLRSRPRSWRTIVPAGALVLLALSAPYLGSRAAFVHDIAFYDVQKVPGALSWQVLLPDAVGAGAARAVGYGMLLVFAGLSIALARIGDLRVYVAACLVGFLLCSKVVLEQYLIWPLPWLVLLAAGSPGRVRRASLLMAGWLTLLGMVDNETFHPLGRSDPVLGTLLALSCAAYLAAVLPSRGGGSGSAEGCRPRFIRAADAGAAGPA